MCQEKGHRNRGTLGNIKITNIWLEAKDERCIREKRTVSSVPKAKLRGEIGVGRENEGVAAV